MASVLKVKRSSSANAPSSLHTGEIAITFGAGLQTNSGDRVFIGGMGAGDNLNSTTAAPIIVGGKYFTDMMDHVKGELTASSAIIADANSKINNLKVDNIDLNGNTISTTDTNGNLDLNPNGSGKVSIANTWTIPRSAGTNGYVLTTNGNNEADWAEPNTHLYIAADTGASETIDLLTETLTFEGSGAINTATGTNKITFSVDTATDAILGVATFNTASFTVSAGDVTIKNAGVSNAQLVNNDVTFGTSVVALGGTSLTLAGLQQLDVDNIRIDGNTISSTNNNGNISFSPNGAGVVNLQTIKTVLSTANNDAELTTNGASDLTLTTNSGIASGFIKINTGSNGNIELTPNGTGQVLIAGVNFASFNADTYYVSHDNGLNTNNGRTSFTPFQTLKYALSVATAGDTIVLFPGEYNEVFPLTVPAGVTVRGAGIRSTTIKPTLATDDLDCFLLNGETTIEELTIKDMFYNTVNNTGYAFRFNTAATVTITTRSPYIQKVTVLNKGSTTTSSDPYGFVSGDSGRGALVDGSRVSRASLEASMLFNECTFIVPNSRALIMTNGARVEWLSCFTYFADLAIEGLVGASGRAGDGKTYVTLGGTVTGTFINETVRIQQSNSSTIDLSVADVLGNTLVINGKVDSLEGVDFTPQSIIGQSSGATATAITRYDRKEFAAELRAISSANLYGNQGVRADGDDVILQLMAHNFAYIGTGFDLTNNSSTVNQANEVLESNSGIVYYNSVDQSGNFRVGDIFNANFKTGAVSFSAPVFEVNSLAGISFTDGSNITIVNPSGIQTGNINIAGNSITTDTGGIILDPIGTNNITLNSNTVISGGTLTIGAYTMPTADGNNGQALITNGNGTVSFTTISTVLTISGDSGGTDTISLLTDTLTISGTDPVQTAVTNNTITISIDNATTSAKGIASFNQDDFDVTTGAVILKDTVLKAITTDSGSLTIANHGISILGGEGLNVTHTSTTITVEGEDASDTNKGIASFSNADFTVTSGQVVLAGDVVQSVTTDSGLMTPVSNTFSILGGEGLNVTHTDTTITVEGEDASASNKGVASFSASYFTVTAGDVAINDATVNSKGVASFDTNNFTVTTGAVSAKSITLGTTVLDLGSTDLTLAGLQQLDVDNIRIDGNEISSTDADGNISLKTNGTGTIDVNSIRITNLATPIQGTDAANKNYVDAARSGLDVKQSVRAASTGPLTLSNTQTVDGVALSVGNRILVKDQNVGSQNGIYEVKNGAWTRAADFDEPFEVTAGVFFFVEEGIINADNGFVLTSNDPLIVGTDTLIFTQFSGAGQITAGDGLSKSGNTLSVNVNNSTGGIEISADAIQLMSSVAGNGLTYTDGVIAVGGTANRITISADAVDIASTYIGQTSITTLGTITTGTWNGSTVMAGFGGTGFSSYSSNDLLIGNLGGTLSKLAVGAIGKMLQVIDDGSGGAQLAYSDFDGGTF
jgi:hypothetical protein